MKVSNSNPFMRNEIIYLHTSEFLENQRIAGRVAGGALNLLENMVKQGTTKTMKELDKLAEEFIRDNNCKPTFLGYKNFPASVCISINNQLVHGVPTDRVLENGDLVSFDLGATYKGSIGDTAITCIYGEPKSRAHIKLIEATKEALQKAIEAVQVGKRIGVIGNAIWKSVGGKYGVVVRYGGHGIGIDKDKNGIPHAPPFISNRSTPEDGIRIQENMSIAIEPLLVIGNNTDTEVGDDGWTVYTKNISAHEEHTIFIHKDSIEIITARGIN